jgi:hypothetical protein
MLVDSEGRWRSGSDDGSVQGGGPIRVFQRRREAPTARERASRGRLCGGQGGGNDAPCQLVEAQTAPIIPTTAGAGRQGRRESERRERQRHGQVGEARLLRRWITGERVGARRTTASEQ